MGFNLQFRYGLFITFTVNTIGNQYFVPYSLTQGLLLHLVGVFEFTQMEVVPDGLGLNRAICINTVDNSHYVH